ncbi:hypothetical protein ANN_22573 [Periplaneta americana]|uniref:Uncharacterized protein n=1 Tax=Periplaneta americana TaxID=6978 RepID=A0ABQ8S9G6_PERAM|nr:hypothetical protein ANN_22573 [Periplaneta americana]
MAGSCEGGNEPAGSLKAIWKLTAVEECGYACASNVFINGECVLAASLQVSKFITIIKTDLGYAFGNILQEIYRTV